VRGAATGRQAPTFLPASPRDLPPRPRNLITRARGLETQGHPETRERQIYYVNRRSSRSPSSAALQPGACLSNAPLIVPARVPARAPTRAPARAPALVAFASPRPNVNTNAFSRSSYVHHWDKRICAYYASLRGSGDTRAWLAASNKLTRALESGLTIIASPAPFISHFDLFYTLSCLLIRPVAPDEFSPSRQSSNTFSTYVHKPFAFYYQVNVCLSKANISD
jgi:hypothetical protein